MRVFFNPKVSHSSTSYALFLHHICKEYFLLGAPPPHLLVCNHSLKILRGGNGFGSFVTAGKSFEHSSPEVAVFRRVCLQGWFLAGAWEFGFLKVPCISDNDFFCLRHWMPAFILGGWNFESYDFGLCACNQPSVKSLDFESPTSFSGQRHCTHVDSLLVDSSRLPVKCLFCWPILLYISIIVVLQVPLANHWMCRWLWDLSVSFLATLNSNTALKSRTCLWNLEVFS